MGDVQPFYGSLGVFVGPEFVVFSVENKWSTHFLSEKYLCL